MTIATVTPSAGVSRSNDTDAASAIAAIEPHSSMPVQPQERQPLDRELAGDADDPRPEHRPERRRDQHERR